MNWKTLAYWSPRVLGILGILFISLFSLDTFGTGAPLGHMLMGLVMHLLPTIILIAILVLAWMHERVGGIAFIIVSLAPFLFLSNPPIVNATLSGPFFITGALFLVSSAVAREKQEPSN